MQFATAKRKIKAVLAKITLFWRYLLIFFVVIVLILFGSSLKNANNEAVNIKNLTLPERLLENIPIVKNVVNWYEEKKSARQREEQRIAEVREKVAKSEKKLAEERRFNRLSFFLSTNLPSSLMLPVDWQGHFLTIEEKNEFALRFVDQKMKDYAFFKIWRLNLDEWQQASAKKDHRTVLFASDKSVLVYQKFPEASELKGMDKQEFTRLQKDLELVISSYKQISPNKK